MVVPVALVALLVGLLPGGTTASDEPWSWPVGREGLQRRFDPPATEYGRGHRGIDVAAPTGTVVRAVAPGRVVFAGSVAGTPVVTVDHGSTRSTYQPVRARVAVGDAVDRGDALGTLTSGHGHCSSTCLHLGRVADDDGYLDPLDVLGGGRFRLITPDGPPPPPPPGYGSLLRPVRGPVTSAFGMRTHPITGVRKLHDGTDFGARCGTPVRAAAAGTVIRTPTDRGYGRRVLVRHGDGLVTGYAHLSSRTVGRGDRVGAGDVVGRVGSTGMSTGCHLHFMVLRKGRAVDPASML